MPSRRNKYNLVEDAYDTRIPLHSEDAFSHGIHFQAKYIGTLDVPRPSSRVEIVAAMRRIRYEFKAKAIKKKKVNLIISVDGIKVSQRRKKKKKKDIDYDEEKLMLFHHPVYRVFYVSHDSQDLKIFSYIARDGQTNVFKCNVFKSNKKSQAMRIVRSIGQAFEVCHKLSLAHAAGSGDGQADGESDKLGEENTEQLKANRVMDGGNDLPGPNLKDIDGDLDDLDTTLAQRMAVNKMMQRNSMPQGVFFGMANKSPAFGMPVPGLDDTNVYGSLSMYHQRQLLQQQLQQQEAQTQVAMAQVQLLKDQLAAETAARMEAQARVHQMLLQNKELLQHQQELVLHIQELEMNLQGTSPSPGNPFTRSSPMSIITDVTTPRPAPVILPEFPSMSDSLPPEVMPSAMYENSNTRTSSDSTNNIGLMDMSNTQSSDSLSDSNNEMNNILGDEMGRPLSQEEVFSNSLKKLNIMTHDSGDEDTPKHHSRSFDDPITVDRSPINTPSKMQTPNGNTRIILPVPMQDATSNKLDLNVAPVSAGSSPQMSSRNFSNSTGRDSQPILPPPPQQHNINTNAQIPRLPPPIPAHASADVTLTPATAVNMIDFEGDLDPIGAFYESNNNQNNKSSSRSAHKRNINRGDEMSISESGNPIPQDMPDTRLHISFSDDENTENSEDSGVPRPPRALESMNFDEIDSLSS